ncbi:anthranilate phosphoribosyltransferase [Kiloniella laminariae]|uniref:Anthranilate phosphoribosyltransferase n=1 Tax=Kiloniella laminariae TaxID=454162 RepID=A0ABT4LMB9_9PROT|nr:anthranilate phosphoribosyltransferase [Kiloniella laminariae]MCZ4282045.1 anthranilate phosphoribosyltransferase [Kiloniella laminariae]
MTSELNDIKSIIAYTADGNSLSVEQAEHAFLLLMTGEATPSQIAGLLMSLRVRGETVEEITGAARAMRRKMRTVKIPASAIDVCGTGGDAKGTLNVSTATAFVSAAAGAIVAKHGNRAASSKSGASDVLGALGIAIEASVEVVEKALGEIGTCFLAAPLYHSAMRHVGPTRAELGTRTIFNLLGPLSNPGKVTRQLTGVFAREWVEPVALVLKALGHEKAWVVHGAEGLDELSISGLSYVSELDHGQIRHFEVTPEMAGLKCSPISEIIGADAEYNAKAMRTMLSGQKNAYRDAVLLNTSAALIVAGIASDLKEGSELAAKAIDSGAALAKLDALVSLTSEEALS